MLYDKCDRCGHRYPGFHICVDLSTPEPKRREQKPWTMTDSQREGISQAQRERWERVREENAPRDQAIIDRYNEGRISYRDLAKEFRISHTTVVKIMRLASDAGFVTLRVKGHTLATGAQ